MTFECVVMALARLTDTARTGKSDNLSLETLHSKLPVQFHATLEPLLGEVRTKTIFAREFRNKLFAHYDYEQAVGSGKPLNGVMTNQIDDAISAINKYIKEVHLKHGNSKKFDLDAAMNINDFGGAHHMIGYAHEANKARQLCPPSDKDDEVWRDLRS